MDSNYLIGLEGFVSKAEIEFLQSMKTLTEESNVVRSQLRSKRKKHDFYFLIFTLVIYIPLLFLNVHEGTYAIFAILATSSFFTFLQVRFKTKFKAQIAEDKNLKRQMRLLIAENKERVQKYCGSMDISINPNVAKILNQATKNVKMAVAHLEYETHHFIAEIKQ